MYPSATGFDLALVIAHCIAASSTLCTTMPTANGPMGTTPCATSIACNHPPLPLCLSLCLFHFIFILMTNFFYKAFVTYACYTTPHYTRGLHAVIVNKNPIYPCRIRKSH